MRLLLFAVAAVGAVLLLTGASSCTGVPSKHDGVIHVTAPPGKCWSGAMGDSTKEGCGSKDVLIQNEEIIVANAQKMTDGGWTLTLTLEVDGKTVDTASTRAEFGIAEVSEG